MAVSGVNLLINVLMKMYILTLSFMANALYGLKHVQVCTCHMILIWLSHSVYVTIAGDCSEYHTCSQCQMLPGCGWCRDPSDTGLGLCSEGGFLSSTNELSCVDSHWFFDTCPCKLVYSN